MLAYDTGALLAAGHDNRRMWAMHRRCLARGVLPLVPAGVLAATWRGGASQALLVKMLAGCKVEPLDEERARTTGVLAGLCESSELAEQADLVGTSVVECAIRNQAAVITSDPAPIERIAWVAGAQLSIAQV